jgi:hypothetical protein
VSEICIIPETDASHVRRIGAMLRAILVGLLAVSATSSCSGGSDAPKVAPGAVAGKVLEASGSVAATRGGLSRALGVGAEVFADDVIDTANGSVLILLHHNNARWAVESGARTRVDQSLAWKLAKQDGPAGAVDHASSAAGREGERTAADTRATTERGESERMRGTRGGAAAESMPAPPTERPAPTEAPETPRVAPPPPESRATTSGRPSAGAGAGGGVAGASRGANERKPDGAAAAPKDARPEMALAPPPPPPPPPAPSAAEAQLRSALEARRDALLRCVPGKLELTLVVRVASGTPTIELTGGTAAAPVRACLERVVKQIPLAGVTAKASLTLTRSP